MPKRTKTWTTYELPFCPACHAPLTPQLIESSYSPRYDAYFCPCCLRWLEAACADPRCDYCFERPLFAPGPAGGRERDAEGA